MLTPVAIEPSLPQVRPHTGRTARFRASVFGTSSIGGAECLKDSELATVSRLAPRELKKLDRFSILAVAGANALLDQAAPLPDGFRERCGVFIGNMTGGWTFTARELSMLHAPGCGPEDVSPYLATAWFPAAPQGQISIHCGLRGTGKTYATDRTAGAEAIAAAIQYVARNPGAYAIGGGVEAPATPFVQAAYGRSRPLGEQAALALFGPADSLRGVAMEFAIVANNRRHSRNAPSIEELVDAADCQAIFQCLETHAGNRLYDTLAAESASIFIDAVRAIQAGLGSALIICAGTSNICAYTLKKVFDSNLI